MDVDQHDQRAEADPERRSPARRREAEGQQGVPGLRSTMKDDRDVNSRRSGAGSGG